MKIIKGPKEKTRQAKRSMRVSVEIDGVQKEMTAVRYCDYVARQIPIMHVTATGVKIDHLSAIRTMYMKYGLKGINTYVDRINELIDSKNRVKMKAVRKIKRVAIVYAIWQAIKIFGLRFWSFLWSWRKPLSAN